MAHCPSCGGVIGRDCFNPVECAQITASMQNDDYTLLERINQLEYEVKVLMDCLLSNSIEIPSLEKEVIISTDSGSYIDDGLPF